MDIAGLDVNYYFNKGNDNYGHIHSRTLSLVISNCVLSPVKLLCLGL